MVMILILILPVGAGGKQPRTCNFESNTWRVLGLIVANWMLPLENGIKCQNIFIYHQVFWPSAFGSAKSAHQSSQRRWSLWSSYQIRWNVVMTLRAQVENSQPTSCISTPRMKTEHDAEHFSRQTLWKATKKSHKILRTIENLYHLQVFAGKPSNVAFPWGFPNLGPKSPSTNENHPRF